MALPKLTLRNFSGGLNSSDLAAEIDQGQASSLINLFVDKRGRLRYPGGRRTILPTQGATIQAFRRYYNAEITRLVFAAAGQATAYDEYSGTSQVIGAGLSLMGRVEMANLYDRLFVVDSTGPLRAWYGTGNIVQAGITPPATQLTLAAATAGPLTGTYQYYQVFGNAHGLRSNPSPISPGLLVAGKNIQIGNIAVSIDPQVTLREIYRLGGDGGASVPRLVATISDNVQTTFLDTVAEGSLSLTQAQFNRDVCLPGGSLVYEHLNRLFVAGFANYPYRIYYSTLGLPEYFPIIQDDPDLDGGAFDVSPEFGNPVIGLCSTGSAMVIGRPKSVALLLGSSYPTFIQRPVAATGVASHRAMAKCGTRAAWLGNDAMVYRLDQDQTTPLGLPIENKLRDLEGVYLQNACAAYVDQRYVLCIPRGAGQVPVALAYDFRNETWTDLSDLGFAATQMFADASASAGADLLFATAPGYKDPSGAFYSGVVSALTRLDTTNLPVKWGSADFDMGDTERVKRAKSIVVEGNITTPEGAPLPTLTITAILATMMGTEQTVSHSYPLQRTAGVLLKTTVHPGLEGQTIRLTLEGNITGGEFNLVQLEYAVIR